MLTLGFSEFIRNLKRNILVIVQLIAVYVIAIFAISSFIEQYKLIEGVSGFFDDSGIIIFNNSWESDEFVRRDVLEDILTKVENIEYSLSVNLNDETFYKGNSVMKAIQVSAYNSEINSYVPELINGQWVDEAESEIGIINAVVSNNLPFKVNIGEIVEYAGYSFKIVGIVSENEMLYGQYNNYGGDDASYLSYYNSVNSKSTIDTPLYAFIISYEDFAEKLGFDINYSTLWGEIATIDFEDEITEGEMQRNISVLNERYGYELNTDMYETTAMYEYSWKLMEIKIMPMIMLGIMIVVVLLISLIISGAVNILYEKRNYGIYFICGNKWRKTFLISMISWSILAVVSIVFSLSICMLVKSTDVFNYLALNFTLVHTLLIGVITLAFIAMCTLIPYAMLRSIQPVSILKDNYE